jgi:mRNA interferase HigB
VRGQPVFNPFHQILTGRKYTCAKGIVWREATGYEPLNVKGYGDPTSNAESMALRRAAAKFGLCLYLYGIGGNKYRLITKIRYNKQRVYIIHVLTHKEYDREKWKDDCNC